MRAIRWPHPGIRLRLTLTYTALFLISGAALLSVSYVLVKRREQGPATAVSIICTKTHIPLQQTIGSARASGPGPILSVNACQHAVEASGAGFVYRVGGSTVGPGGQAGSVGGIAGPPPAQVRQLTATVAASEAHVLHSFALESGLALAVMAIVSLALSWWIAGRVLQPVHRITDAARKLSERTLDARINMRGPNDEIKQLADTFDAMLARLDRAFASQHRFVANASHELRTPLATERVLIDEALANQSASPNELRAILEQLRTNSEDTEVLIDALLTLARSERGIERWGAIDLAATAANVVEQASTEAAHHGVSVESDLRPGWVHGDSALVERLIANLVENAIRHNIPDGTVRVSTQPDGDMSQLDVTNTGPNIDPETVSALLEPFRKAQPDRSSNDAGLGLGLSIVDAIVTSHHGTLALSPQPGGGLNVRVRLPSHQPTNKPSMQQPDPHSATTPSAQHTSAPTINLS
ncbi:MAG: sensor histidine kinase [Acidimicrobiia bacterium]